MKLPPAPIRFLLLVVGAWVAGRAAVLMLPPWMATQRQAATAEGPARGLRASATGQERARPAASLALSSGHTLAAIRSADWAEPARSARPALLQRLSMPAQSIGAAPPVASLPGRAVAPVGARSSPPSPVAAWAWPVLTPPAGAIGPRPADSAESRVSGSAWLFVRERGGTGLAPGGTLGGSQAGARLAYRLNGDQRRPVSLSGRIYAPLDRPEAAEAAVGIDWRPIAGLPLNLLAERRQRAGREGRSDFAVTIYGGIERRLLRGRVQFEAYGQAGMVGIEEGDFFADGAVVTTTRIGPIKVGGGAWGGTQPGASRLDLGPHASFRLPAGRVTIRAAAEWRFRIAGDAQPASGPALTISAGF